MHPYEVVFKFPEYRPGSFLVLDTEREVVEWTNSIRPSAIRRYQITLNHNLLFGVLSGVYIWQSVDYLATFKRTPDIYDADFQVWLNRLHV